MAKYLDSTGLTYLWGKIRDAINGHYVTAGQKSGTTLGDYATAEGYSTTASGEGSHAEGINNTASGNYSHAEGSYTTASGSYSHAEGYHTTASGARSHAEGWYTTAQRRSQHVFGEYNVLDATGSTTSEKGSYIEIVGKGTSTSARSNARTLDWSGNEVLAGKLTIGAGPTNAMDVATKNYVDVAVAGAGGGLPDQTGQNGKFLTTDGTAASWANVDVLPSQSGQSGKFLTTNGTTASWVTKPTYTAAEVGAVPSEVETGGGGQYGQIVNSAASGVSLTHANSSGSSKVQLVGRELTLSSTKSQSNSSIVLKTNNTNVITLSEGQATIIGVVTPTTNDMAANKGYVDSAINALTIPTRYNASTNPTGYLTMADLPVYNGTVV